MAKQTKSVRNDAEAVGFVIGRDRFAKISTIEGIQLTDAMKKSADDSRTKGLTAEEYRQTIIATHRKG
jgi:hypothetical protein